MWNFLLFLLLNHQFFFFFFQVSNKHCHRENTVWIFIGGWWVRMDISKCTKANRSNVLPHSEKKICHLAAALPYHLYPTVAHTPRCCCCSCCFTTLCFHAIFIFNCLFHLLLLLAAGWWCVCTVHSHTIYSAAVHQCNGTYRVDLRL